MRDPSDFCRAIMHDYERQWSRAGGHAVRHPLRLKMNELQRWCDESPSVEEFEAHLASAQQSDDPGTALLAEDLAPLWRTVRAGGPLPFLD